MATISPHIELGRGIADFINGILDKAELRDVKEEWVRKNTDRGAKILEQKAIEAAADRLGLDISGGLNTKTVNDLINKKLEGSGIKITDIFNKRKTKADIAKFATKKINETMPTGLKFRSLARQDINRGVKNYVKSAVKKAALERASELILDDDLEVLAMITAYSDGRGISYGNKDATGASRQADFRANHVYGWVQK